VARAGRTRCGSSSRSADGSGGRGHARRRCARAGGPRRRACGVEARDERRDERGRLDRAVDPPVDAAFGAVSDAPRVGRIGERDDRPPRPARVERPDPRASSARIATATPSPSSSRIARSRINAPTPCARSEAIAARPPSAHSTARPSRKATERAARCTVASSATTRADRPKSDGSGERASSTGTMIGTRKRADAAVVPASSPDRRSEHGGRIGACPPTPPTSAAAS